MIRTAIALAQKGMAVFPCRPQDKRPATANGLKDATTDLDIIRQWWRQEPQFNLAIATGAVSGIFVVDIDGLDAEVELRRLEAEHGGFPSTVEAITARGRHVYFRSPETPVRNSASKIAPGIDVRGDGGYVLAPPSIHPSGRRYEWSVDCATALADAPAVANRQDFSSGHRCHTSAAARGLARACRERCRRRHARLHDREAGRSPAAPPDRSVRRARASPIMECNKMRAAASGGRH